MEVFCGIHSFDALETINDTSPLEKMNEWACYHHYNCRHRCKNGACIFSIIFAVETELIKQKRFEGFLFEFKRDSMMLFNQFNQKFNQKFNQIQGEE